MRKVFKLTDLDCAHCAQKIEDAIAKLEGVEKVHVNFLAQKMTLVAADERFEEIARQAAEICRRVEPDCTLEL